MVNIWVFYAMAGAVLVSSAATTITSIALLLLILRDTRGQ